MKQLCCLIGARILVTSRYNNVTKRAVAITGLADHEGPTRQRYADVPSFPRHFGHLAALRWPIYFFPRVSLNRSFRLLRSANMRFRRRLSPSIAFIWLTVDTSVPLYLARRL